MFPKDFLWGAATSSHQTEGNNNNDWTDWEKNKKTPFISGEACRHYDLFEEDFQIAKSLNHNCHRFSVEWSRIEPEKGVFDDSQINHYKDALNSLKQKNIKTVLSLHHFTNPLWFIKLGGWLDKNSSDLFQRFTEKIIQDLGENIDYWITINEPNIYAYNSYLSGIWPPGEKNPFLAKKVLENMALAHKKAYQLIHARSKQKPLVSIAHHMRVFSGYPKTIAPLNSIAAKTVDYFFNDFFLNKIKHNLDFIGLNYYTRDFIRFKISKPENLFIDIEKPILPETGKNSLGWEIYPEGLFKIASRLKKYKLPILITENGICIEDDSRRWDFISSHLKQIEKALSDDINIIGYLYWSLVDNFEWEKGFAPKFGLVEIDYNNFSRKIRQSALKFAQVCRKNSL